MEGGSSQTRGLSGLSGLKRSFTSASQVAVTSYNSQPNPSRSQPSPNKRTRIDLTSPDPVPAKRLQDRTNSQTEVSAQQSKNGKAKAQEPIDVFDDIDFGDDFDDFDTPQATAYMSKPAVSQTPTSLIKPKAAAMPPPQPASRLLIPRSEVMQDSQAVLKAFRAKQEAQKAALPKKREMPWDRIGVKTRMEPGPSKSTNTDIEAKPSNLRLIGEEAGPAPTSPLENLTNPALNIKQKISLSPEQQRVLLSVVEEGKSVFFTGSAGTGKSVLLREIITSLRKKYRNRPDVIAVTASTGMAACNIGGTTVHSFAGFGLGKGDLKLCLGQIRRNKNVVAKWLRTKVLIIDEVSMLDAALFDRLIECGEMIRKTKASSHLPFGGIQLVITGDFFQLPPVSQGGLAFEAKNWGRCIDETVKLTQVFRQKDSDFIDMLNECRMGLLSESSKAKFRMLSRPVRYKDGIEATELFPVRSQVEQANQTKLRSLPGEEHIFTAEDSGTAEVEARRRILESMMAPEKLVLKVDAQVMMLKNMPDCGLVNGSVGTVIEFMTLQQYQASLTNRDRSMTPVIGRERSMTPAREERAESSGPSSGEKLPVVRWSLGSGSTMDMLVSREDFKVEEGETVKARRRQLPLLLSWAMSIHKAQGQTIQRLKCDLAKVFERGQAYVALSRACSLESTQILNFNPSKVTTHPKVVKWYQQLQDA
ncbi:hypothetical protein E5Q_01427 [Mixia osmundae IAM 14324]|uniref:ATP-dependent DNA helicase PIF1 n=1 Tax=Mixia osmundae (strain CBS 9802 / IAM 14324 / JCM 22182 / KY 12970) TaxID=764103 RepID=G7DW84_MIXOS|nr:hypothetical protein E5Q_01427 [Mixia osmundae IAM 14324]